MKKNMFFHEAYDDMKNEGDIACNGDDFFRVKTVIEKLGDRVLSTTYVTQIIDEDLRNWTDIDDISIIYLTNHKWETSHLHPTFWPGICE